MERERSKTMKRISRWVLSGCLAAALMLTGCGRGNSSGASSGGSMGGGTASSGSDANAAQTAAWRTGLGVQTELTGSDRAGKINTVAAAVLLDADGRLAGVMLDEAEISVSADGTGSVTLPTDLRTKRQKGEDYPLAAVSSLQEGWTEQAGAFARYLTGMTAEQVEKLETDADGKPVDADLLAGCTIAVNRYRDAVVQACKNASVLGAAKGDTVRVGMALTNATKDRPANDDSDLQAQMDITITALTTDAEGRVTSAIGDMTQPALTVSADGTVSAPRDAVRTKNELGDQYGMRGASSLDKEWYEHSAGYCSYLKGKTRAEVAAIPTDGSDADLAALCTISVTDLQKAALTALETE